MSSKTYGSLKFFFFNGFSLCFSPNLPRFSKNTGVLFAEDIRCCCIPCSTCSNVFKPSCRGWTFGILGTKCLEKVVEVDGDGNFFFFVISMFVEFHRCVFFNMANHQFEEEHHLQMDNIQFFHVGLPYANGFLVSN